MQYLHLIGDSFKFLVQDFTGISFNIYGFSYKLLQFLEVLLLIFLIYLIGRIILRIFFKDYLKLDYAFFLCISLGYIFLSSLIFLLGFTGFLYPQLVIITLVLLYFIVLLDLTRHKINIPLSSEVFKFNPYKYFLLFFILISFLRLLPPQSAGDPLDYHLRFPRIYLHEHSMMIPPLGDESYALVPQLPEMLFVISQIFTNGEASRMIHFAFFVLICILLYRYTLFKENGQLGRYTALLFASSPIVLELSYQAFSDYPGILCLLLCLYILLKEKISRKSLILCGILFGGVLASKFWILLYFPFVLIFLIFLIRDTKLEKIRKITYFILPMLIVVSLWYIRGFLIKGNPFYVNTDQGRIDRDYSILKSLQTNLLTGAFFNRFSLPSDYGPLYLLGLIVSAFMFVRQKIKPSKNQILLFFMIVFIAVFLPYTIAWGRYTVGYMIFVFMLAGYGFVLVDKYKIVRIIIFSYFSILGIYFFINTLPILPYGLGWADKNAFLKRELVKDFAAYYDFNGQFSKNLSPNETIITYTFTQMYYADFMYKNAYYFIDQKSHILSIPPKFNKILIRGGDFEWFCSQTKVINCSDYKVSLITHDSQAKQYLYKIKLR